MLNRMPTFTIYFDSETGGVLPKHPTIQLAAIAINDETGEEIGQFECKIRFDEAECDPEALKMNHYTPEAWKDAIAPDLAALKFAAFAKPFMCIEMVSKKTGNPYRVGKLAGHNALTFDLPRLRQLFGSNFFPFSYHVRDTLQRALWYFDEHLEISRPDNLKLGTLCSFFGIDVTDGAHDALYDVRLSAALARAIQNTEAERMVGAA